MPLLEWRNILVLAMSLPTSAMAMPHVLNSSFEDNTATSSTFNMQNQVATETIANLTAFGGTGGVLSGEIDLSTDDGFFGSPQNGNWFVTTHTSVFNDGVRDEFSLDLSEPLVVGEDYDLAFFANAGPSSVAGVEVGLSTSPTEFGTLVFASSNYSETVSTWTQLSTSFNANFAATHLTFRSGFLKNSGASIDNIRLLAVVPEPSTALLLGIGLMFLRGRVRVRRP